VLLQLLAIQFGVSGYWPFSNSKARRFDHRKSGI